MGLLDQAKKFISNPLKTANDTVMGGDVPGRQVAELDQDTQNLINTQKQIAARTPDQQANIMTEGQERGGALIDPNASQMINQGLAMQTPESTLDALSKRAERNFQSGNIGRKTRAKLSGNESIMSAQNQAFQNAAAQSQRAAQEYQKNLSTAQNERAQRNQLLGSLLGAGGSLVGTAAGAYAGGPGGAKVGGQVGGSAGALAGNTSLKTTSGTQVG